MRRPLFGIILAVFACACAYSIWSQEGNQTNEASAQDPAEKTAGSRRKNDRAPFTRDPDPAAEAAAKELERDENIITVRTANRFHLAVIARLLEHMPPECELSIQYGGILATDDGNRNFRVVGSIGNTLQWTVSDESLPVFGMTISTKRTKKTLAACRIGDDVVFVSVDFIQDRDPNDPKSLDEPRAELGMFSVRKTVQLLEREPGDLEKE